MSQSVYLGRFLTKTCYTNNGQMTRVISHSYIIGLRELYNFVKYCKYDFCFWGEGGGVQLIFVSGRWEALEKWYDCFFHQSVSVGHLDCYVS